MSCITCHNPHVSVKFTPRSQYLNACQGCHGSAAGQHPCSETAQARAAKNNDCVTCHMPHNGSIDIPHVAVTDHFIRKRPVDDSMARKITAFLGLKCFNNDHPGAITTARGYMEFYERYAQSKGLLDSALFYLGRQSDVEAKQKQKPRLYTCLLPAQRLPKRGRICRRAGAGSHERRMDGIPDRRGILPTAAAG